MTIPWIRTRLLESLKTTKSPSIDQSDPQSFEQVPPEALLNGEKVLRNLVRALRHEVAAVGSFATVKIHASGLDPDNILDIFQYFCKDLISVIVERLAVPFHQETNVLPTYEFVLRELVLYGAAGMFGTTGSSLLDDHISFPNSGNMYMHFPKNNQEHSRIFAGLLDSDDFVSDDATIKRPFTTPPIAQILTDTFAKSFSRVLEKMRRKEHQLALGLDDLQIALRGKRAKRVGFIQRFIKEKRSRHALSLNVVSTLLLRLPLLIQFMTRDKRDAGVKAADEVVSLMMSNVFPHVKAKRVIIDLDRKYGPVHASLQRYRTVFIHFLSLLY